MTVVINSYLLMTRQLGDDGFNDMRSQVETLIASENRQNDAQITHAWAGMGVLQLKCDVNFIEMVKNLTTVGGVETAFPSATIHAVKKTMGKAPGI